MSDNILDTAGKAIGGVGSAALGVQLNFGVDVLSRIPEGTPEQAIGFAFIAGAGAVAYSVYNQFA
ncbi:hypothetical protein [Natronolimnobius baerhuensis]|uniref:hypothetical protein n=1 Tax=Natronolimnobius baerhuensis TaxID=253108 RepID=UPI001124EFEB|nr:hypothetical protein [Natronolimnobius baerhuensis]